MTSQSGGESRILPRVGMTVQEPIVEQTLDGTTTGRFATGPSGPYDPVAAWRAVHPQLAFEPSGERIVDPGEAEPCGNPSGQIIISVTGIFHSVIIREAAARSPV